MCKGTGNIPAWYLSVERGEHQGVKAALVLVHGVHNSPIFLGRGFWQQGSGEGVQGVLPWHPTELPACSGIPVPKLCSESAITTQ